MQWLSDIKKSEVCRTKSQHTLKKSSMQRQPTIFHPGQAASAIPIIVAAHYIAALKNVPTAFRRSCIANAYIAFLYHGMQRPCTHKGLRASYSSEDVPPTSALSNDRESSYLNECAVYRVRRARRYADLSLACLLPTLLGFHDLLPTPVLMCGCALAGLTQGTPSLTVASSFLVCAQRYFRLALGKRFIATFVAGCVAFGNCPTDKWLQHNRYMWHACVSQSFVLAAHLIRGNMRTSHNY